MITATSIAEQSSIVQTSERRNIYSVPTAALSENQRELLSFPHDHDGNAQAVCFLYPNQLKHTNAMDWLIWNGKHWERDRSKVRQMIVETLRQREGLAIIAKEDELRRKCVADNGNVNGVLALLEDRVKAKQEDFDSYDDFLPVQNGIVDLRTGELSEHKPAMGFTSVMTAEYHLDANYSEWQRFVLSCVDGNEEVADFLQRWIGYSLTGLTREEKMLYIFGPTRSGKGTFTEPILCLFPKTLAQEKDMNSFVARRDGDTNNFDLASLVGVRFIAASETERYHALNAARLKTMTGGNHLTAAFKGKDSFTFQLKGKITLSSNFEINADADDDAIWSRVIYVTFPNSHLGEEDTGLKARFKEAGMQEGILKWAIDGAVKWYHDGLKIPACLREQVKEVRDKNDSIALWIDECVDVVPGTFTLSADVTKSYEQWCHDNMHSPQKAKRFTDAVRKKIPSVTLGKKVVEVYETAADGPFQDLVKKERRGYIGLRLKS